jgi:hypothetical protein
MPQTKAGTILFEASSNDPYSFDVRDTPKNRQVKENYAERQPGRCDSIAFYQYVKKGKAHHEKAKSKGGRNNLNDLPEK